MRKKHLSKKTVDIENTRREVRGDVGETTAAMERAYAILSYRQRSTSELETKLKDRGFAPDIIKQVCSRLQELGFLNDEKFARDFTASRIKNKNWGRIKINAALRAKGLPGEIIEKTINGISEGEELNAALTALSKWLRRKRYSPLTRQNELKATRFLQSRGFTFSVIHAALATTKNDVPAA